MLELQYKPTSITTADKEYWKTNLHTYHIMRSNPQPAQRNHFVRSGEPVVSVNLPHYRVAQRLICTLKTLELLFLR